MIQAAKDAIEKYGTGCTGSRLLNGTLDIHEKLEDELARFMEKDRVITFTTGYMTNLGVISALTHKGEYVISDEYNHASIVDGCRMSKADTLVYKHQDMQDLEAVLRSLPRDKGKLIVSDGVFSMEGNIAKIPQIVELAEQYDAAVMIDDAHGVGYLGDHGEGSCGYHKCIDDVDLIIGTFSKSFASVGGFAAGDEEIVEYLMHHARSFIFSASPPPAAVESVRQAIRLIQKNEDLRNQVLENADMFRNGLNEIGYETGYSETPIVPVIIGKELKTFFLWKRLLKMGVFTNPVRSPAVPKGRELLRTSLMANHTDKDINDALKIFKKAGRRLRVIPK
jgi:8-amino-7-oxononanoate synthase